MRGGGALVQQRTGPQSADGSPRASVLQPAHSQAVPTSLFLLPDMPFLDGHLDKEVKILG